MKVLEKEETILLTEVNEITLSDNDKEKILTAKNNYINSWKSYSINEAYNLWLTKLNF